VKVFLAYAVRLGYRLNNPGRDDFMLFLPKEHEIIIK